MFQDESCELHSIIKKLRLEKGLTKEYVSEYLGIDLVKYDNYELARSTPCKKELKMLAELYGLTDELLGAKLPIITKIIYPEELLIQLETTLKECPGHTGDYHKDKLAFVKLNSVLQPVLEIEKNACNFPDIDLEKNEEVFSGQAIQLVELNPQAKKLISDCLDKLMELI